MLATYFYAGFLLSLYFLYVPPKRRFDTLRTTMRYIPEDDNLHNDRCENLKSYLKCTDFENKKNLRAIILNKKLRNGGGIKFLLS
jgi:hypothetical protein